MCTVWAALFLFLSPFPFRYRFAALLRTPSPLTPSLSFIHLSLSSSLNHVPFFFFPAPPSPPRPSPPLPSLRAVTLVFPDSPSSSVLLSPGASPFSCYLFVFCALSIFLPLLSPAPPIFPLPYAYCPCSVRLPPPASLSFLTPSSLRAVPSSSLPSLSTYPAASVETARFFPPVSSAPIFFTPFSPPPSPSTATHAPLSPAIGISPRAFASSPSLSCRTYAHGLSPSRPVYPPPFSSSHSSTSRFPLTSLSFFPAFHPRLCLSLFCPPPSPSSSAFHPCGSYLFDFFFTATRPPTDAARRRPFSIGTLFSTIGSTTYSRTHVRTLAACARGRDGEIKKGVKRELVDVGGKGGPGDVREERG